MAKKKTPQKTPASEVAMQVRVPPHALESFKAAAAKDNRTLSGWVRDRLEKAAKSELAT